ERYRLALPTPSRTATAATACSAPRSRAAAGTAGPVPLRAGWTRSPGLPDQPRSRPAARFTARPGPAGHLVQGSPEEGHPFGERAGRVGRVAEDQPLGAGELAVPGQGVALHAVGERGGGYIGVGDVVGVG